MRKLLTCGFVLASLSLATNTNAADLAAKPVYKAPPPVVAPAPYNWTGFYVGAHFGGGWARNAWDERSDFENGFGRICHSKERDGDSQITTDGGDDHEFEICPFETLSEAPGSTFGKNGFVGSHNAIGPLGGFQA